MDDTKSKWNNRKARNPHNKELVTKEMRVKDHNIVRVGLHCLVKVSQSYPTLCNPWTAALQAPLSMGFSRQEYWSGLPCPPPRYLPDPRIKPNLSCLLHWRAGSLPLVPLGKPDNIYTHLECVHSALYCRYFIRQNHRIGRDLWSILSFNRPQTY